MQHVYPYRDMEYAHRRLLAESKAGGVEAGSAGGTEDERLLAPVAQQALCAVHFLVVSTHRRAHLLQHSPKILQYESVR